MKVLNLAIGGVAAVVAIAVVSRLFGGCAGAPTRIEQALYSVETNREPVVTLEPVVTEVAETNAVGTVVTRFETNRVWVTNMVEAYQFTPNEAAQVGSAVVGRAVSLLGPYGEMASVLVGGLLAAWGYFRSSKANKTAGVLAQVIETGRQLLQNTPQGKSWDDAWKNWMITHQAEEGAIEDVMGLLSRVVDNASAKSVADDLLAMMKERSAGTPNQAAS